MATKKGHKIEMVCLECGKEFKKTITSVTADVRCPKCHGVDTEPK